MSSPVAAGARGINGGLSDHLLANGNGTTHTGAAANGHSGRRKVAAAPAAWQIDGVSDKTWVAVDQKDASAAEGGKGCRPLLFQTKNVRGVLLHPYRLLIVVRAIAVVLFFIWRLRHKTADVMWLWATSMAGDVWFGVSWFLNQIQKFNPTKRVPDLAALRQRYDPSDGCSGLPGVDVFVTTADPINEPILYTMNSILSILATDYPVDRYTCYLSDDGGALAHYEAMLEVAKFAELWVPFCRKHCIEPRAPENYFEVKTRPYTGGAPEEFVNDHRRVRREYDEFKVRIDALSNTIRQRSDEYNRANSKEGDAKATWMADGTQWQGTWIEPAEDHKKGQHAPIVKVVLNHPSNEPQLGLPASADNPLDFSTVDVRLAMLVYLSREKRPDYDHQKKAGAMNVQLRVSALLSNAPFIINFDCDHYINNSQAFRAAVCFMLDPREGDNTAFVQFPQRFDDVDPTDRYCNHNRVFFDATLLALNGIQGPSYIGTGSMFRRVALYGVDSPRWRPDDVKITYEATKYGNSKSFLDSMPTAASEERSITPPPVDELPADELTTVMTCAYEDGTEWGRGVGWVYNIATEDVVTGFRVHRKGWRSMYCAIEPDAFRGTAPINLTERIYQILRWSGGSLEMFFSHNCPLLAGRRVHPMQRIAYLNMTVYPITSLFIVLYGLFPVMWLFSEQCYIQKPFGTYVLYLVLTIAMIHVSGLIEVKWAGLTLLDWCRNEQFYMIGATTAYPMAVLYMVLKLIRGKGISFRLTSKQTTADANEKFADLYVVRWVPLMIPGVAVLAVNVGAIGVAIGKAVVGGWSAAQMGNAALGLLFNVWILLLIYPFALGIMGRWGKRPVVLLVVLVVAFGVVALMYVALYNLYVNFVPFQTAWPELTNFPFSSM